MGRVICRCGADGCNVIVKGDAVLCDKCRAMSDLKQQLAQETRRAEVLKEQAEAAGRHSVSLWNEMLAARRCAASRLVLAMAGWAVFGVAVLARVLGR